MKYADRKKTTLNHFERQFILSFSLEEMLGLLLQHYPEKLIYYNNILNQFDIIIIIIIIIIQKQI